MSASDIRDYVDRLVDEFPSFLRTPARWVADRVFGVWNEVYGFLSLWPSVWGYYWWRFKAMADNAGRFAVEVATTVRWLVVTALPRWANWALSTAVTILRGELSLIYTASIKLINEVKKALTDLYAQAYNLAKNALQWSVDRVSEIWSTLAAVRDKVVQLLTHPEILVDWIFSALWKRFWRFFNDHAEAIAGAAWGSRDRILTQALTRIENFLMRVL